MRATRSQRVKKSYSLSREAESFVRKYRKSHRMASDSAALNSLLLEAKAAVKRIDMDAAYKAYYDSATDEELSEENEWTAFAGQAFAELSK